MRIITRRTLREFWERHPQAHAPLAAWHKNAKLAEWRNFAEVRADYNSADYRGQLTIFDIGGNKYRLVAYVRYTSETNIGRVWVRHVFTHAQYDGWSKARSKR